MLDQMNAHVRDARIRFFEEGHRYEVDGQQFVSVTTVIKRCFPEFNPDEAIKKMRPDHPLSGKPPEYIKAKWARDGEEARNAGTEMHRQIEVFLNTGELGRSREFRRFHDLFTKRSRGVAYRTEWMIFDEETGIAGTIDYLYKRANCFAMTDWKRSRCIEKENPWQQASHPVAHLQACKFQKYCLQLNIYRLILLKHYGIKVEQMALAQFYENSFKNHAVPLMEEEARHVMELARN